MTRDGSSLPRRAGAWPAAAALLGLGLSAALWTLGGLATPAPALLAALLAAAAILGAGLLAAPRVRRGVRLAGLGCLASSAAFVAGVFAVPDGPVPVVRRPGDPRQGDARPPARLRLVDWNVLHGYPALRGQEPRTRRLAAALRELEPTVVVLQEAWSTPRHGQLAARLGAELGMSVAYARANGSRRLIGFEEGTAVLSRLAVLEARRKVLTPRRPWWQTRIALTVTLALGDGTHLEVVGTHLASGDPEVAADQARDLASRLGTGFVIVAGDLNAPSGGAAAAALEARGLEDLVPGGIDHVFMRATPSTWRLERAGWALEPGDLAGGAISDHPAIVVDLLAVESAGDRSRDPL